jgi:hypothetical protein
MDESQRKEYFDIGLNGVRHFAGPANIMRENAKKSGNILFLSCSVKNSFALLQISGSLLTAAPPFFPPKAGT